MAKARGQRSAPQKLRENVARKAQVVTGKRPAGSAAPATLPKSATPRVKPKSRY